MRFAMCDARSVVVIDGALGTKSLQKEKKKNLPAERHGMRLWWLNISHSFMYKINPKYNTKSPPE
jgi:hypothetical protein